MKSVRNGVVAALAGIAALSFSSGAAAQWKPTKPINVIVPWAAGGATDQLEQDFQFFINGLRRYGRNVAKVVWATGGGNVGDYANGKARANTYGLRVQHDLNDLREQFGSQPQPAPSSSTIY